jgi:hypothetical protein
MNEPTSESLGSGLSYEDVLPLRWQRLGQGAAPSHLAEANAEFLRLVALLEEHQPPRAEKHPEFAQELLRIESKVNLLLDMMGRLLARQSALPEPVGLSLNTRVLHWVSREAPAPGERLLVELYLKPPYPRPLALVAKVQSTAPAHAGQRTTVLFEGMDEQVREWLEKMIFRHHRRRIAQTRHQS